MKYRLSEIFIGLGTLLSMSCSPEEVNVVDSAADSFRSLIGGSIDRHQVWASTVQLKVKVVSTLPVTVLAYDKKDEATYIYDEKQMGRGGEVTLTVPQGLGDYVTLQVRNERANVYKQVKLKGLMEQSLTVDLNEHLKAPSRVPAGSKLYGEDIQENIGYCSFPMHKVKNALDKIVEQVSVESSDEFDTNYELESKGPFYVSMVYGCTGSHSPRTLGYYYHSPGTYEDMKYVDLTETHIYDYLRGRCKVQYQLDYIDKWYDSNFDNQDGFEPPYTYVTDRLNDGIYCMKAVMDKYNDRVTRIQGVTYLVDVPEGYHIGFYLKLHSYAPSGQIDKMVKAGLPSYVIPEDMCQTNFTAKRLNLDGRIRSLYHSMDGFTIMGMEDANVSAGNDHDCNDVVFGVDAELEIAKPKVVVPDVDIIVTDRKDMPWTIAFEDVHRSPDFDFNDAVIRIEPHYDKGTADIYACAVGTEERVELWLSGDDGEKRLCEMHEVFGDKSFVNTTTTIPAQQERLICSVPWSADDTMEKSAGRLYCKVKRGDCDDCGDILMAGGSKGDVPNAVLVPGRWQWPREEVSITEAYKDFSLWSKDVTNTKYWQWHTTPVEDKAVRIVADEE